MAQANEALYHARAGQRAEALRLIRPLEADYENGAVPLFAFENLYAALREEETALEWAQRSADRHEWQILALGVGPVIKPLLDRPGFRRLRHRIGLD
jgi:hypothetical protein